MTWLVALAGLQPGPGLVVVRNDRRGRAAPLPPLEVIRNPLRSLKSTSTLEADRIRDGLQSLVGKQLTGVVVAPAMPVDLAASVLQVDIGGLHELVRQKRLIARYEFCADGSEEQVVRVDDVIKELARRRVPVMSEAT